MPQDLHVITIILAQENGVDNAENVYFRPEYSKLTENVTMQQFPYFCARMDSTSFRIKRAAASPAISDVIEEKLKRTELSMASLS